MDKANNFKCKQCHYFTNKLFNIERHYRSYHGELRCAKCEIVLSNIDEYKHHINFRSCISRLYKCMLCDYSVNRQNQLDCHMVNQHGSVQCKRCNLNMTTIDALKTHRKQHDTRKCIAHSSATPSHLSTHQTDEPCATSSAQNDILSSSREKAVDESRPSTSAQHDIPSTSNESSESTITKKRKKMRINIDNEHNVVMPDVSFNEDIQKAFQIIYKERWKSIMTFFRLSNIMNLFNYRLSNARSISEIGIFLRRYVYPNMTRAFKISMSPSFILMHRTSGELRYYHPGNNNSWSEEPFLIRNQSDFEEFIHQLSNIDLDEVFAARRPDSSYIVLFYTALAFFVYETHIPLGKVGMKTELNDCVIKSKHLLSMITDKQYKIEFEDNLCFF
jgi:hypothetical protein